MKGGGGIRLTTKRQLTTCPPRRHPHPPSRGGNLRREHEGTPIVHEEGRGEKGKTKRTSRGDKNTTNKFRRRGFRKQEEGHKKDWGKGSDEKRRIPGKLITNTFQIGEIGYADSGGEKNSIVGKKCRKKSWYWRDQSLPRRGMRDLTGTDWNTHPEGGMSGRPLRS